MTLTTRLLWFYLGSLAVLLVGFSTAIYLIARDHLYRQADERLEAALNTLGAAVEVSPDGVEWEPSDRALRVSSGSEPVAWVVTEPGGGIVAWSDQPEFGEALAQGFLSVGPDETFQRFTSRGEYWQAGRRWFRPPPGRPDRSDHPPVDPKEIKFTALAITTAVQLDPVLATLRQLVAVLAGTSLGVLAVAGLAGRLVCRRALRPVRRMADDARAIDSNDPTRRIVTPTGGDELTDLGVAFNGLLDRLHESAERHRRFAGDASHQLRTPLAALLGQIEVALRRDRSAGEYREALATAQAKATHLQRIVESLLFLTRAGAEAVLPQRERVDLAAWLTDHLRRWGEHPRAVDFRLVGVGEPLLVASHPILLGEALNVLLDNACRYSPSGSPIAVTLSRLNGWPRIEVADQGPGIAAADLPQVFSPFFRTTDALKANRSGVGLGLSIARTLTEALGGELTVVSREGAGSAFTVTLPVGSLGDDQPEACATADESAVA